jgi:anti-sigma B factor antagonist
LSLSDRSTACDGAARPFQVDAQPEPRGVRVRPVGEIDMATVGRVRRKIDECVADGCERVVLDLRGVSFMDSSGVHLVLDADAAARAASWELLVVEGPWQVRRVFELTGLRERLTSSTSLPIDSRVTRRHGLTPIPFRERLAAWPRRRRRRDEEDSL